MYRRSKDRLHRTGKASWGWHAVSRSSPQRTPHSNYGGTFGLNIDNYHVSSWWVAIWLQGNYDIYFARTLCDYCSSLTCISNAKPNTINDHWCNVNQPLRIQRYALVKLCMPQNISSSFTSWFGGWHLYKWQNISDLTLRFTSEQTLTINRITSTTHSDA